MKRNVLIVDDEAPIRRVLRRILEPRGCRCLEASGVQTAMAIIEQEPVDLVLSDINLEDGNGLELVSQLKPLIPDLAVVMVTSTADARVAVEALERGAYGYVMKPFQINEIVIQVDNALRRRDLELAHRDQEALLKQRVRSATEALRRTQEEVALRLIAAAEYRDNETGAHIRRLGLYAAAMGQLLDWEIDQIDQIRMAAPMHDVGKIGIPDAILQKKGKLTEQEWEIMKTHAEIGRRILSDTGIPLLDMGAEVAGGHHERWDGAGYPGGLTGEEIGVEARIVAIVDVYDALTHQRCYKPAWPEEEAVAHIQAQAGAHFDPNLVTLFVENLDTMRAIRMANPDDP